ncbi:MAG: RcnB family protein [Pseudomonadota bacterium]
MTTTSKPALLHSLAFVLAGMFITTGALAEKPDGAGNGKGKPDKAEKHQKQSKSKGHKDGGSDHARGNDHQVRVGGYFNDAQRPVARSYFENQYRAGRCPPGLAKKNNGCMPPGQARKWSVGQPLPRQVVYYSLPPAVVVQLGPPPQGHRYVRVAADILLIAIATQLVVDAIQYN